MASLALAELQTSINKLGVVAGLPKICVDNTYGYRTKVGTQRVLAWLALGSNASTAAFTAAAADLKKRWTGAQDAVLVEITLLFRTVEAALQLPATAQASGCPRPAVVVPPPAVPSPAAAPLPDAGELPASIAPSRGSAPARRPDLLFGVLAVPVAVTLGLVVLGIWYMRPKRSA